MSVSQSDFYGENFWGETLDWEKQASDAVSELCEPTVCTPRLCLHRNRSGNMKTIDTMR